MALIIRGSTRCAACGDVIAESDQTFGLPHFTADPTDALYRFTDSGFHFACFDALPERDEIIRRVHALDEQHGYPPRFRDIANPS